MVAIGQKYVAPIAYKRGGILLFWNRFRWKDAEPCPCGSEIAYKDCCKGKSKIAEVSKKPPEVLIMEKMRKAPGKCCLHPDSANCKGKIKEAHALQNNKIISILAGSDRHVYMLDTKRQPQLIALEHGEVVPIVEMNKVSANKATTQTCFCDLHDTIAFAVIEKGAPDFDDSREDMKFVYAYKAFIFEYYKQFTALNIFRQNFKENPAAFQDKEMVAMYRMLELKSKEFEPVKVHFDSQIMSGTFDGVTTCAIEIPEQIKFANYAYVAPTYDMNGKRIKHTKKGVMHRLAVTIFPEMTRSWVLMSCLDSEKEIYSSLFQQMKEASVDKLKLYLNMIFPLLSENMVLSTGLWDGWDQETQAAYTYYANLNGPSAINMEMAIGVGLRNLAKSKNPDAYKNQPKLNLFS